MYLRLELGFKRPMVWVSSSIDVANDLAYLCPEYKVYLTKEKKPT